MGLYWHVAVKSFQKNLAYRAANVAGIATNLFFGAVYVLVYRALFADRAQVGGFTVEDTVTYAVIAQSLLMVMSAFGNRELSEAIVKGTIAVDLARPIDFYCYWAAVDLGRAVYFFFFRGVPTFLLGALLFGVEVPASPQGWLQFFTAVVLGMLVSFAFRFITNSLAFWTSDIARGPLPDEYAHPVLFGFHRAAQLLPALARRDRQRAALSRPGANSDQRVPGQAIRFRVNDVCRPAGGVARRPDRGRAFHADAHDPPRHPGGWLMRFLP